MVRLNAIKLGRMLLWLVPKISYPIDMVPCFANNLEESILRWRKAHTSKAVTVPNRSMLAKRAGATRSSTMGTSVPVRTGNQGRINLSMRFHDQIHSFPADPGQSYVFALSQSRFHRLQLPLGSNNWGDTWP